MPPVQILPTNLLYRILSKIEVLRSIYLTLCNFFNKNSHLFQCENTILFAFMIESFGAKLLNRHCLQEFL